VNCHRLLEAPPGRARDRAVRLGLLASIALAGCVTGRGGASSAAPPTSTAGPATPTIAAAPTPASVAIGTVAATIAVGTPRDVMAAFGSIWVSDGKGATITRIDPATNKVQAVIATPGPASVLANGGGAVWVTSYPGNSLTRIDPATNTVARSVSLADAGAGPIGVTFSAGALWVADHDGTPTTSIAKVDPATMKVVQVIPVGHGADSGPTWVATGAGSIWTNVQNIDSVVRIDPTTGRILATIPDGGSCAMVVASDTAVWAAGGGGDGCSPGILHIDPATNAVAGTTDPQDSVAPLALGPTGLWFGTVSGALGRVDPATQQVVGRLALPGSPFGATIGFGDVWLTDTEDGQVFRIHPG
jgi:YVTN family beta-propeller protein